MKKLFLFLALALAATAFAQNIDRREVVMRNNPKVTAADSLGSLSVGNGHFATTVDVTGLQSYPLYYKKGVSLCAQSDWGWHSYPNPAGYTEEETLGAKDLGHGHQELYAVQHKDKTTRGYGASEYYRINPHRLNLGAAGILITDKKGNQVPITALTEVNQSLDMWAGVITSSFKALDQQVEVQTVAHPSASAFSAKVVTPLFVKGNACITFTFPYPSGGHVDDASDWTSTDKHTTEIVSQCCHSALLKRTLDSTIYYARISWEGTAELIQKSAHQFALQFGAPKGKATKILDPTIAFTIEYTQHRDEAAAGSFAKTLASAAAYWQNYWNTGAIVDFSQCTDERAKELERRVVLSQYLTAVNCQGNTPPQESGLTLNTWFGRPHLEMTWWHTIDFSLFGHEEVLARALDWYNSPVVYNKAREIASRQGFNGIRWMKMTDPWAGESPSNVGSFLLWQQPHYIYFAEEMYRHAMTPCSSDTRCQKRTTFTKEAAAVLDKYGKYVDETAQFMADFCTFDSVSGRYNLIGATALQETMSWQLSYNQPFELAYWRYGLLVAQQWRERRGLERVAKWDDIIEKISPLPERDGIYLAGIARVAEDATYRTKTTTDHPAVLAACGMLPQLEVQNGMFSGGDASKSLAPLFSYDKMRDTYRWVMKNHDFADMWGWDFGVLAMSAARLGLQEEAVQALVLPVQKNTYLNNGHNYQNERLKIYLPGNGAILESVAMMCAGWEGCPDIKNPGFPQNGKWNVRWEGLHKMQ